MSISMCEFLSNGCERRSRHGWIINSKFSRYLRSTPHLSGHQAFQYQLISNNIPVSLSLAQFPNATNATNYNYYADVNTTNSNIKFEMLQPTVTNESIWEQQQHQQQQLLCIMALKLPKFDTWMMGIKHNEKKETLLNVRYISVLCAVTMNANQHTLIWMLHSDFIVALPNE